MKAMTKRTYNTTEPSWVEEVRAGMKRTSGAVRDGMKRPLSPLTGSPQGTTGMGGCLMGAETNTSPRNFVDEHLQ